MKIEGYLIFVLVSILLYIMLVIHKLQILLKNFL